MTPVDREVSCPDCEHWADRVEALEQERNAFDQHRWNQKARADRYEAHAASLTGEFKEARARADAAEARLEQIRGYAQHIRNDDAAMWIRASLLDLLTSSHGS